MFSAVIEEGTVYNAPLVSVCAVRELLRCELCKDEAGASALHEGALTTPRHAANSMPGAREDLIELLRRLGRP